MSEKKNKGGRPRKYKTNADRQRAYYERKKRKMVELEEKLAKIQKKSNNKQTPMLTSRKTIDINKVTIPWKKISPAEISLIGNKELERLIFAFKEKTNLNSVLRESIFNLVNTSMEIGSLESLDDMSEADYEQLNNDIETIIQLSQENNQQQTLLYLLEAELASRTRSLDRELKLDILELEIKEFLEGKKAEKKDEIKISRK